jgi:hypothetical protein
VKGQANTGRTSRIDCRNSLLLACSQQSTSPVTRCTVVYEGNRKTREGLTQDSSQRKFGEGAEMVESVANQCRGYDAVLLCRCCDLEQSLPTEIHWK